jgi:hypothetical protein
LRSFNNDYFECLYEIVNASDGLSYRKLLRHLHGIEFIFSIPKDANRAADGQDLRYRFGFHYPGPCSVLEMMVALALRCEETIMDDPRYGNRTSQWFWGMIVNLGLGSMVDERYDEDYVDERIDIFLKRKYKRNGEGGLFHIRNCEYDLRKVEIWTQLLWYLDNFTP